ncbi:hypothetical protein COUCH_17705 [Couchioplanes caeruleus]|uniref:hypothetical protein n=1 Tax=Couchioplanes caeruleus TaxID=56438 RepID=UPI0020C096E6|nr:hypothetical protein [Couchioplanes caeruleus]UQU68002.1 hypothetical protein COUCH_17705 [Couchioplanes caeruleus]
MSDLPGVPADRDLPPRRAERMRQDLLRATRERPRHARRWLAAAVATGLTLVAAGAVVAHVRDEPAVQVLAMGPGELDGTLRRAADECLEWAGRDGGFRVPLGLSDLAVSARQGDRAAVLFLSGAGYAACDFELGRRESSGGINSEPWAHREWLPGPVQRLSLSSSEADGGAVAVLGRVTGRVHRLVLEHGDGRTTTARLRDGAFGIVTRTADVRPDAELVSYDAAGHEIDRRPLFPGPRRDEQCWTDPAGTVMYGTLGGTCRPAERWNR